MGDLVTFPSNGDSAEGYLALPPSGRGPALVVIQEWWGLVPHIRDLCDRFAAAGFVALAPDLYHGESTTEPDEAGKKLMALDLARASRDIAGAASYLVGRDEVSSAGTGIVGFCMGGALALWSATYSPDVVATVDFYPYVAWPVPPDWSGYRGKGAQLHLAEGDGGSAAEPVQAAIAAIRDAGGEVEFYDYPGTEHAFFNDSRPEVHDVTASALAWQRTLDFLHARVGS